MTAPEFSRPIRIDTLGEGTRAIEIEADTGERAALSKRFGLITLDKLSAAAVLTRAGDVIHAKGRIVAAVVQACVASGGEVPAAIDEPFVLRFVSSGNAVEEIELDENALDEMEYEGSAIDLGEAAAQTLALALDPFPRAKDADQALRAAGVIPEEEAGSFSALKGLRDLLGK